ncbi:beta-galactosidase [Paenibacillus sp. N4]|uniref:glycoside hydrolase family 35 protein n=1 Tax=Paenibacillus vietnamensis TaxID=2590547 RepID=UPI001CD0A120|nr:beta-galactosidase [Paenibacillus vietnamensis]MCA0755833.1 beta-galactosidase [Paenibacillus vietnamensis]
MMINFVRIFLALLFTTAYLFSVDMDQTLEAAELQGKSHTVTWDKYSLLIDGQRLPIWSAEFHYWRLPSRTMWMDAMQKIKASGFNAVSIYFDWAYHSPKQGVYDFTGIRDIDALLDMTKQAGLYVIVRPGPYINAETDSGGFPGWLQNTTGKARTSAPDYTAAYREWLSQVNPILARHQITRGGNVILYQVENEYFGPDRDANYMQDLIDKAKAGGIDVPTFHNDVNLGGLWASGKGAPDLYAFDSYPLGFDCSKPAEWGKVPVGIEKGVRAASPTSPIFIAEYQGGSFDKWGGSGYAKCREKTGPDFINVFYKGVLSQGATLVNAYMGYGGTNWGWLPGATYYTSYDYGASIDEAIRLTPKAYAMKKIGYMLQTVNSATKTEHVEVKGTAVTNPALTVNARRNPDHGTTFWTLMHAVSNSASDETTKLKITGKDGSYTIPQKPDTSIRLNGRDSKTFVSGYSFGAQRLVYSTSELMTHKTINNQDIAVLYGRNGEDGETVLRYAAEPSVEVLTGTVTHAYDNKTGDLRLNYTHSGMTKVKISGGGADRNLILWLGTDEEADRVWMNETERGPVLVRGPYLVRTASVSGNDLALMGDTDRSTEIEILANGISSVTWNGGKLPLAAAQDGSMLSVLGGPPEIQLPELTGWKFKTEAPEKEINFDDSGWTTAKADNLRMDAYGYHYGYVWYRGHFKGNGQETNITLHANPGDYGRYHVWLNGTFIGGSDSPETFKFPAGIVKAGQDNVIGVLAVNMGHNQDFESDEAWREPRGLITAAISGATSPTNWKIQGAPGGENIVDKTRGIFNTSGLYGERKGWHLPRFNTSSWHDVTLPHDWSEASAPGEGVSWYKTQFTLNVPDDVDAPIGIHFDKPDNKKIRARLFINGWNMGMYMNHVGPQSTFYVPKEILHTNGVNDISIAVWGEGTEDGGLGRIALTPYGVYSKARGGSVAAP